MLQKVYVPQSKLILYVALALCCSDTIFLGSRHGPFPAVFTHQVSSIVESQGYPSNVSPQVHVSAALPQPQPPPPHQGQPGLEVHTETAEAAAGGGKNVPLYVDRLDEALRGAENGQKIFIEAGVYMVSQGGSSHYVSGKNVSLVGASTKYCALLYQNTKTPAPALVSPNLVKRLTFRNANSGDVKMKTKFFGIGGGHVQIEVSKYFVRKYLAMI